jgi:hypothetical protein
MVVSRDMLLETKPFYQQVIYIYIVLHQRRLVDDHARGMAPAHRRTKSAADTNMCLAYMYAFVLPIEDGFIYWGLVLKCYELRTRQHKRRLHD